jgi:glycosyltransferase involved in cell wall biosynthesis
MKASVIITSYNYEKFVVECVQSVLNQSVDDIEIILVNDGSSDNTVPLVEKMFNMGKVKLIDKENGGQLSAFNSAMSHITGDIVFFIDADDMYEPNYIKKVMQFYEENTDADFIFSAVDYFGEVENMLSCTTAKLNQNLGYSLCKAWFFKEWIGAPTTTISMRKSILEKILPLQLEADWKIRADDCLVWGASLVGANK